MISDLPKNATLKQLQEYIIKMKIERNFDNDKLFEADLLLGECNELISAVRKHNEINTINHMNDELVGSVREEIADVLIYLLNIANQHNIDLDEALREKEAYNDIRFKDRVKKCS